MMSLINRTSISTKKQSYLIIPNSIIEKHHENEQILEGYVLLDSNTELTVKLVGKERTVDKKVENFQRIFYSKECNHFERSTNGDWASFNISVDLNDQPDSILTDFGSIEYSVQLFIKSKLVESFPIVLRSTKFFRSALLHLKPLRFINKDYNVQGTVEGSKLLLVHKYDGIQIVTSPFRPTLTIAAGYMPVIKLSYTLMEHTISLVKTHRYLSDTVTTKETKRKIITINPQGPVLIGDPIPMEIYDLSQAETIHQDVHGSVLQVKHTLCVKLTMKDGGIFRAFVPIQLICTTP